MARRSAHALVALSQAGRTLCDILTESSIKNAMVVHAAFGGSTNLILHIPAIAFAAGLPRPTVEDWHDINVKVPRLVSVLPNGPFYHPTVRAFLAGGVPEVMLHLRELGLLDLSALTITGEPLEHLLAWWETSERRKRLRDRLYEQDSVDPDDVIMSPVRAREHGLTSTVTFPRGNLAPEGSVIKSTAIDPTVVDPDGVYRKTGPARVFTREREAIAAIKGQGDRPIRPGDVLVLMGRGPLGAGMEEIFQITSCAPLPVLRQARRRPDGRPILGCFHRRVRGACQPGGPGRRSDRQGARWRPGPDRRGPSQPRWVARLDRL